LCRDCHACPGDKLTEAEAIAAWNTRIAASDRVVLVERIATLAEALAAVIAQLERQHPVTHGQTHEQITAVLDTARAALVPLAEEL
jgi:hypothetical protein